MFISFGYLNKKSLLFLILPLIMIIRYYISDNTKPKVKSIFYPCFIKFLCCSISGILWLVVKITTFSKKKEVQDNKKTLLIQDQIAPLDDSHDFLQKDESKKNANKYTNILSLYESDYNKKIKSEKKNNCIKTCFLIVVYILDFLSVNFQTIYNKTKYSENNTNGQISLTSAARLFSLAIFTQLIVKNKKMYSHHYLSAIIILIILIGFIIFSLFTETENEDYFLKLGLMILQEIFFSIMYVLGEVYLSISDGNIYKFLFIDGIIGMILSLLLQVVSYFFITCDSLEFLVKDIDIYCDNDNRLNTMIKNLGFEEFGGIFAILNIITLFLDIWLLWLLIFTFSANHFGVIYTIPLIYRMISSSKNLIFQ